MSRIIKHHMSVLEIDLTKSKNTYNNKKYNEAAMKEEVVLAIFLYLHKVYDALDRSRCLDILEGYGVGPRALILFCRYLDWL